MILLGVGVLYGIDARDTAWLRVSHDIAYSNHKQLRDRERLHAFALCVKNSRLCVA